MPSIPIGRRVFLDTNVLLYAVTEHPGYGKWADVSHLCAQRGILGAAGRLD